MTTALTAVQALARDTLITTVKSGLKTFVETGMALMALRDEMLFVGTHETFTDFLRDTFGFTPQRGSQLIGAAQIAVSLETTVDIPNERVARELKKLENPADRRTAATIAFATAPDHIITSEWMAGTVAVLQEAMATEGFVDLGKGGYAALNAGISHEVHQAMLTKRAQIQAKKQKPLAVFEATPTSIIDDCLSIVLTKEQKHLLKRLKQGDAVRFVIYTLENKKESSNVETS